MARKGGPANLAGVDYQILYTACRFAEAITQGNIVALRPEAHLTDLQPDPTGPVLPTVPGAPAIDDLTITHEGGAATEYVSLKQLAGQAYWNATQFISRGLLDKFFQQYQKDPEAWLILVSQSPPDPDLRDCVERAGRAKPGQLATLESGPLAVYQKLATHLKENYLPAATTEAVLLHFFSRIVLDIWSAEQGREIMHLRLQPHTQDAPAAGRILYEYAMRAGREQRRITPDDIRRELTSKGQPLILPPAVTDIQQQLEDVSKALAAVPATVGHLPGHHLTRPEVTSLVEWVLAPLPPARSEEEKDAARCRVVTGGAGAGKTVVLRDVYQALRQLQLPVLALKADRIKGISLGALRREIKENGLTHPINPALAVAATPERPAVVLIDQLDALSMCLGADRGMLTSYTELLGELQRVSHIRFIISCRTFDLQHDPELAPFRKAERIEVGELSKEQVDEALQAAGVGTAAGLSPAVIRLLQTPLHLAIYCALDPETRTGEAATSLQGLYHQLLHDHLLSPRRLPTNIETNRVKSLLYDLAEAMNKKQQLTLPSIKWKERDIEVCRFLETQGILSSVGPGQQQLTFFHQTFYEYLFARQFVTREQSLSSFVLASGQGLFLRPLIQQVLMFQRGNDFDAYLRDVQTLLTAPACRFHIKLLLVQYLATQPRPEPAEVQLVQSLILPHARLAWPFVESVSSRPWLELLAAPAVFPQLSSEMEAAPPGMVPSLPNTLIWVMARFAPDLLLPKLIEFPTGPHRTSWLIKALDDAGATPAAGFTELFTEAYQAEPDQRGQFIYWRILADQAEARPSWVAQLLLEKLADPPVEDRQEQHHEYARAQIIKRLWKKDPQLTFSVCSTLLRTWIRRGHGYRNPELAAHVWNRERYPLFPAPYAVDRLDIADRHTDPGTTRKAVLHYCWKYLENPDSLTQPGFQQLVAKWLHSRTNLLVTMALAAAAANPAAFTTPLLRLFLKPRWLTSAVHQGYLGHIGYYTCLLLPAVWDAAASNQRQQLADILASPDMLSDVYAYQDRHSEKKRFHSRFGLDALRYLQLLGTARLTEYKALFKYFEELTRRWGTLPAIQEPDKEVRIRSGGPRRPSQKWNIDKVSPANWLRALRKYRNRKEPDFFSEEATYEGLCDHLNELIKAQPAKWVSLLEHLLNQQDESLAMLLPQLCDSDAPAAAPLVELAYKQKLLNDEAYRRLRRKVGDATADPEQPVTEEFLQHDLETVRSNLKAESTIRDSSRDAQSVLITAVLNTPGARELYKLLSEKLSDDQVTPIVELLREVAAGGSQTVRAAAVGRVAMLLRTTLAAGKIIDLFQDLTGSDYALLAAGQWSLQYLIWRDEAAILRLLQAGLAEPMAHETITCLATVQWGHGTAGALELLKQIWAINPAMRAVSMEQLRNGYAVWRNKTVLQDAVTLFCAGPLDKDLISSIDYLFLDLPPEALFDSRPMIDRYITVCAPHLEYQHCLIDFLGRCVSLHPAECVETLALFHHETEKAPSHYRSKSGLLEVLIEAYTRLPHQDTQHTAVQAALDLFDEMLQSSEIRNDELKKIMNEVTYN
ncbi:NACHT domain-containing NTPase [Hymenobacter sp. BT559]|uniref:NACHT domain-containing protein n=1 Tax=Hymenobacter sp. BT559 TaxID=2795729 RepID=UPI0018EAA6B3|nr:ATP-binding protein [Hymenobacter sp. BT559]MBJ6146387.1 ATP-binding protein [Hymenobacter sp. BT559]